MTPIRQWKRLERVTVVCTCLLHIGPPSNFTTSICSGLVVQVVSALLRGSWQDFNWHDASRGPSAIAELLVVTVTECVIHFIIMINVIALLKCRILCYSTQVCHFQVCHFHVSISWSALFTSTIFHPVFFPVCQIQVCDFQSPHLYQVLSRDLILGCL